MPCDALSYKFVAEELNNILASGKIEKLNMPESDELFVTVRAGRQNHTLVISAGVYPRIHITEAVKDNPYTPPAFCMNLRKNLSGGIIKAIRQQPDERVIFIDILFKTELGVREDKTLVCEIMGKYSNIILVSEDGRIIESLKHIPLDVSVKRQILPGLRYVAPTQEKLSPADYKGISAINFGDDVYSSILKNVKGLAPSAINEAIFNADNFNNICNFDAKNPQNPAAHVTHSTCLSQDSAQITYGEKLAKSLGLLYTLPICPCVLKDEKNGDFFIRPYNSLSSLLSNSNPAFDNLNDNSKNFHIGLHGDLYVFFDSLNKAMDYYYSRRDQKSRLNAKSKSMLTLVKNAHKRAEKRLAEFYSKIAECSQSDDDRIKGELITANIYRIKPGDKALKTANYYEDNAEVTIALDPTLSPAQNAQRYYKKYAKKKRTLVAAQQQADKTEGEKAAHEELIFSLSNVESVRELSDIAEEMALLGLIKPIKRAKNEKLSEPYKVIIGGYRVLIGKNNIQNDRLFKAANKNDIWLHVRQAHGSHVIIESAPIGDSQTVYSQKNQNQVISNNQANGRQNVPDEVILAAAEYAAYFSKAKNADKTEVDYTLVRHVSKPSGSAPGKVVYTNQKTLFVSPKPLLNT